MSKLIEAQNHQKQAEKHLKTSLFRWKPEYHSAADEYNQAAVAYRVMKDINNAKECFKKASEYYKLSNSLFYAAKSLENAMIVSKDRCSPTELYDMATEASNLYQQHGSVDSAALVLDRAAKFLEGTDAKSSLQLYVHAAEITLGDTSQSSGEYLGKAAKLLVRLKSYDEAVDYIQRQIHFYHTVNFMVPVGRLTVISVLVHLARGDVVAAWKVFKEWGINCEASEWQLLETLLQAYDEQDVETVRKTLRSPFIRALDVEYVRLAEQLALCKGTEMALGVDTNARAGSSHGHSGPIPVTARPTFEQADSSSDKTDMSPSLLGPAFGQADLSPAKAGLSPSILGPAFGQADSSLAKAGLSPAKAGPSFAPGKSPAHEAAHLDAAPCMLKPKETIKEPELDEIFEDEMELC